MNIYISHATSFDFHAKLYFPLKAIFQNAEVQLIFPHEKSLELFNTQELFESKKCDFVLAEVSYPSTGQGIELGWANMMNIPIICIHKKDSSPSKSLHAVSKTFIPYESIEDVNKELEVYIHQT